MPVRGLSSEEIRLPRRVLTSRHGVYFSAVMMCMWDNIHGPKVLNVWTGDEPVPEPPSYMYKTAIVEGGAGKEFVAGQMDSKRLSKEVKKQLASGIRY